MGQKNNKSDARSLTRLTMNDLKGKQSVRATFRLPQQVIELLSVISGQLGIKQKSLFDQLIENVAIFGEIIQEAQDYSPNESDRRQKTFVISRSSLLTLNHIAEKKKIPRDILVEVSIKRLLPVIETELEKHKNRKAILNEMRDYLQQGEKLLKKTGKLLSKDDLVYEMIKNQVTLAQKNVSAVSTIIERGLPMENW